MRNTLMFVAPSEFYRLEFLCLSSYDGNVTNVLIIPYFILASIIGHKLSLYSNFLFKF